MKNKKKVTKPKKEKVITTRKRIDNSIEVEVKTSPAKTKSGKLLIVLIIIGMVVIPIAGLILLLTQLF